MAENALVAVVSQVNDTVLPVDEFDDQNVNTPDTTFEVLDIVLTRFDVSSTNALGFLPFDVRYEICTPNENVGEDEIEIDEHPIFGTVPYIRICTNDIPVTFDTPSDFLRVLAKQYVNSNGLYSSVKVFKVIDIRAEDTRIVEIGDDYIHKKKNHYQYVITPVDTTTSMDVGFGNSNGANPYLPSEYARRLLKSLDETDFSSNG